MFRVGLGHDRHRIVAGSPLILGGVAIPWDRRLDGHSDADIVLHALTDALLGAVAAGDIGDHFPNTDPQWRGAASVQFVAAALRIVDQAGFEIANVDITIHAEAPKLMAWKTQIATSIAGILNVPDDAVNVKAKTAEGLGPVGRLEALDADAIVLVTRKRAG